MCTFFSLSRYYKIDVKLARLARKQGAKICVVTNSILSPLMELADIVLLAETKHAGFFNSSAALNLISEYLLVKIAQTLPEAYRLRADERDELTEDMRL